MCSLITAATSEQQTACSSKTLGVYRPLQTILGLHIQQVMAQNAALCLGGHRDDPNTCRQ